MINTFRYFVLVLKVRFSRVFNIIFPVLRDRVSYYPNSVKKLERKFSKLTGVSHSIMFTNATSAIEAALFALGIDKSSVVGSPAFVIPSSYCSASALGAKLEFLDISPSTLNIDVSFLEEGNPLDLKALIVTHFYGNPCDMPQIMKWAKKHNVRVIEDCSHAHGALVGGRTVGSWGDVGVFSLQGAKAVSAGEGAISVTNNARLAWEMAAYGHQQSYQKFKFGKEQVPSDLPEFGYGKKMRAHPLGAELALVDLKYLDSKNHIFNQLTESVQVLANKSNVFNIPQSIVGAKKGGYCQGLPIVFSDSGRANQFLTMAQNIRITAFMRDYTNAIKFYAHKGGSESVTYNKLSTTNRLFGEVVFVPFEQFAIPFKWSRFVKILDDL